MSKNYSNKIVIHKKVNGIEFLQFNRLNEYSDKLVHGISLRHGGISLNEQLSLNFRTMGSDSRKNVLENLRRFCDALNIKSSKVYKGKQAHTDRVEVITKNNKEAYSFDMFSSDEVDGYIVNENNIATLVTTADCNSIIIYDPKENVLANVHSGWKGTISKIYLNAINIMIEKFNCNPSNMIFCIGPSIRKCCFSSEDEGFKKKFTDTWEMQEEYMYYEENSKRFHIDLPYVIIKDALKCGIEQNNILDCGICTMCNSDDFFSYRMATKNNQKDYGTMATIAMLK